MGNTSARRKPRLPRVEEIADRQLYDRVERREGGLYLVDTRGLLADVEVRNEEASSLARFEENMDGLTKAWQVNALRVLVRNYHWMSKEGKQDRLEALNRRWRALYGDADFVVDEGPEGPVSLMRTG